MSVDSNTIMGVLLLVYGISAVLYRKHTVARMAEYRFSKELREDSKRRRFAEQWITVLGIISALFGLSMLWFPIC